MRSPLRQLLAGSILLATGAAAVVFACGPSNTQFVDFHDTPAGGQIVNPGAILCGLIEGGGCDLFAGDFGCCTGPGVKEGGICVEEAGACPVQAGLVQCNEAADCPVGPNGELPGCCATVPAAEGGRNPSAQCARSCPAASLQLCRTNGECPGKKCVVQKCPDGVIYEMCGLSTSPSFPCTSVP